MIDYTLTRSKRKTIAIYVRDGVVDVRAPLRTPKSEIDKFVTSKSDWITKNLTRSKERTEQKRAFTLDYGDTILYLGNEYPIVSKIGSRVGFDDNLKHFYIPPNLNSGQIKFACVQIYRMLAKRDLTGKVLDFAKEMNVMPIAVKINGANSRWGSCSSRKSLNFSWRLIMAGDDVVDYVVVHELSHITEMNHSKRFWAIVENVLPDYRERQSRLKELQKKLNVEDWDGEFDTDDSDDCENEPPIPKTDDGSVILCECENKSEQLSLFDIL